MPRTPDRKFRAIFRSGISQAEHGQKRQDGRPTDALNVSVTLRGCRNTVDANVCFWETRKPGRMTEIGRKAEWLQMGRERTVRFCAWIDE